jgi:hypothetical protein
MVQTSNNNMRCLIVSDALTRKEKLHMPLALTPYMCPRHEGLLSISFRKKKYEMKSRNESIQHKKTIDQISFVM